jgi:plastocyanin
MKRAALAAACVALASVMVASLSAASNEGRGRGLPRYAPLTSTAPECVAWKKHSKRVVKRVKRGGEWRRVVRVKRWRSCVRRAVPPVLTPAPAPPVLPEPPQPEPEDPSIPRLGVKAVEWSYTLSRPEVPAGEVVIELNNMGEDPHNLNVQLEDESGPTGKITAIGPAQQGKGKFALPAGTYRLWCDLDEHEEKGMKATLLVTP